MTFKSHPATLCPILKDQNVYTGDIIEQSNFGSYLDPHGVAYGLLSQASLTTTLPGVEDM